MTSSTGRYVLLATILASSMAFIDGSALNVVLSVLQVDLGASGAQLVWVVNAYLLMLASLILIGGSLGDNYGRNRVFGIGIATFAGASWVCGLAPNAGVLIAARAVQGVGGALMVPGSLAIITANFHGESRGPAIGIWSSFSTITTVGGPVLGGGQWAVLEYLPGQHTITYHHTEVPREFEDKGIAARLVEHAMRYAQEHGLKVNALCPVVKRHVEKHTEFQPITWGF